MTHANRAVVLVRVFGNEMRELPDPLVAKTSSDEQQVVSNISHVHCSAGILFQSERHAVVGIPAEAPFRSF